MALYTDPILQKLVDALNASGPAKLRNRYVIGDPVIIPTSEKYPLCFISRDTTVVSIATTHEDMHEMPVVLNVVYSGTADLHQKAFAQAGALGLYELCEGRDATTYDLRADTIAGVLRSTQVLDGNQRLFIDVEGSNLSIEYVLSPPERRGIFSVEAIIRTTIKHLEVRP